MADAPAKALNENQLLIAGAMSEDTLQKNVLKLAQTLGWRRAHFRPAQTKKGWRTPVEGDGEGFPDLILLRGSRLLVVELKSARAKVKPGSPQEQWLEAFAQVATTYVWHPQDWLSGAIQAELA